MDANKQKALDAALSQIERQFGKGAIMKMGEQPREAIPCYLHWLFRLGYRFRHRRFARRSYCRNLRPLKAQAKPPCVCP